MIDSILNLIFRCSHRRLTRPVAPVTKAGQARSKSYVVCLDCGKHFEYDAKEMRIGKVIDTGHESRVVPVKRAAPGKMKYAWMAAMVPAAVVIGALFKGKKKH